MVTSIMLGKVLAGVVFGVSVMSNGVLGQAGPGGISLDLSNNTPPVTTALLGFYIPCGRRQQFPCSTWQMCVEFCRVLFVACGD